MLQREAITLIPLMKINDRIFCVNGLKLCLHVTSASTFASTLTLS